MGKTLNQQDQWTRKHTAFSSFAELVRDGQGGYYPTLIIDETEPDHGEVKALADHYDSHMEATGRPERAHRIHITREREQLGQPA